MSMLKTKTFFPADVERTSQALDNFNFLTFEAKLAFLQLRHAFTKAPIFNYLDLKCYIRIEIDVFG